MADRKDDRGISRRKLLAGGVVAAPTLALLHETVPHQGLHRALGGDHPTAASAAGSHAGSHATADGVPLHANGVGTAGPTFRAGESVEWLNQDQTPHTVTGEGWASEILMEGGRYTRRFDQPGRYPYRCLPHPQMTGVVIVE